MARGKNTAKVEKVKCPVCGETEFDYFSDGDICEVCGWFHDRYQERHPDEDSCINPLSLNQFRAKYAGKEQKAAS